MTIIDQDSELLNKIIDFTFLKENDKKVVELIIRPECNQKCTYCYITKFKDELFPIKVSNNEILYNLNLIIEYFINQSYIIDQFDLFAGDLFYDDLFFDIINIIEKYYLFLEKEHLLMQEFTILIPCNMSFCEDDEKIQKIKEIYNNFLIKYNTKIIFSYSTDGIYSTDIREQKKISNDFFQKVFKLCIEMGWGVHPMISYENVDKAIENYEWFKNSFRSLNSNYIPYFTLVRNDGWNEEKINLYKNFLKYYMNDLFHNVYHSNLELFFNNYLKDKFKNNLFNFKPLEKSCTIGKYNLMINVQNLSIVPCHRLTYNEMIGGKFLIQDNNISRLEASNSLNSYINLKFYNSKTSLKCVTCKYNLICMKGCFGAQYEKFGDTTIPIPSTCDLLQVHYDTIIDFFHSINLFYYIFQFSKDIKYKKKLQQFLLLNGYLEYYKIKIKEKDKNNE